MKRGIALLLAACLLCSGCSTELLAGLSGRSSYFYRFAAKGEDGLYKVKGSAYQAEEDKNLILVRLTAQEDSTVAIKGKQKAVKGNVQLVYTAFDGTETLIAEAKDREIDTIVSVQKGEGTIGFIPCGSANGQKAEAVVDFDFQIKAGEKVNLSGNEQQEIKPVERPEEPKKPEEIRKATEEREAEEFPGKPGLEDIGFPGIEDNWPENLLIRVDGLYARPLMMDFDVEEPAKISICYTAEKGKLRIKIVNESGELYFEEPDIQAGDEKETSLEIDGAGTYWIYLYAEYFGGEVVISPQK